MGWRSGSSWGSRGAIAPGVSSRLSSISSVPRFGTMSCSSKFLRIERIRDQRGKLTKPRQRRLVKIDRGVRVNGVGGWACLLELEFWGNFTLAFQPSRVGCNDRVGVRVVFRGRGRGWNGGKRKFDLDVSDLSDGRARASNVSLLEHKYTARARTR